MKTNSLFRSCLEAVDPVTKAEFELSFGIADRIAFLLKEKGMTQRELAKKMGKRESEVSKWMTGRHNFTLNTIALIERVLDNKIISVQM